MQGQGEGREDGMGEARGIGKGEGCETDGKGRCEADCAGVFVGVVVREVGEAEKASGSVAGGIDLGD